MSVSLLTYPNTDLSSGSWEMYRTLSITCFCSSIWNKINTSLIIKKKRKKEKKEKSKLSFLLRMTNYFYLHGTVEEEKCANFEDVMMLLWTTTRQHGEVGLSKVVKTQTSPHQLIVLSNTSTSSKPCTFYNCFLWSNVLPFGFIKETLNVKTPQ